VPAALAKAGSAYKVSVPWSEVGAHSIAVMLHGAHVAGSPFSVQAITQVSLVAAVLLSLLWLHQTAKRMHGHLGLQCRLAKA